MEVDFDRDETEYAGRTVAVRQAAISVDPDEFAGLAESEGPSSKPSASSSAHRRAPRRPRRPHRPSNVVRGFRSSRLFLESHAGWHGRVGMLALLDPSRQDIPEYAEYLVAIRRAAREVNDRFATADWTPLELRIGDDFPGSVAAYKQFDVLLVNAIFDGLNLVAKEAPLVNARDGLLVENTGAYEGLGSGRSESTHSTWPARHVRSREERSRWRLQSGADVARRSATGCASTTSSAGSGSSSTPSTRRATGPDVHSKRHDERRAGTQPRRRVGRRSDGGRRRQARVAQASGSPRVRPHAPGDSGAPRLPSEGRRARGPDRWDHGCEANR